MDDSLKDVRERRAVQRAERELDTIRDELDRVDDMLAYLQQRRDGLESDFNIALARRDGLARDRWERLSAEVAPLEPVAAPTIDKTPPVVVADLEPMTLPDTDELLEQWGLADVEEDEPEPEPDHDHEHEDVEPPDVAGHRAPPSERLGPTLDSWGLADEANEGPVPTFVPISDTWRITVAPGGARARTRVRAPSTVIREDTVPISLATRQLITARRMGRRTH